MSIHNEIMNIQIDIHKQLDATCNHSGIAHKMGHRDARHQAAEISLRYELELQKLKDELEEKTKTLQFIEDEYLTSDEYEQISKLRSTARRVLEKYNNI